MAPCPSQLAEVAKKGETLDERLARFRCGETTGPPPPNDRRVGNALDPRLASSLRPWARAVAGGDLERLSKRLSFDDLSTVAAARAFGFGETGEPAPAAWWRTLSDVVAQSRHLADDPQPCDDLEPGIVGDGGQADDTSRPRVAFERLWHPFVRVAAMRLREASIDWDRGVGTAARRQLFAELRGEVYQLVSLAAFQRFDAVRSLAGAVDDATDAEATGGEAVYEAFVQAVLERPIETLYEHFPVAARQACELVERWVEGLLELLGRFEQDRDDLREFCGLDAELWIVSIRGGCSDAHRGGRRVRRLRIEDDSGRRVEVMYKPRPVGADAVFEHIVSWAQRTGCPNAPKAPRVLVRDDYGWVEAIDSESLRSPQEVESYFQRAGALVAFAHALRARDLHAENVIATAAGPVVVDAEMFFQPERHTYSTRGDISDLFDSCLDTGLLLQPVDGDMGDEPRDLGGLRPCRLEPGIGVGHCFRRVGSDAMRLESEPVMGVPGANAPLFGGEMLDPSHHREPLLEGFSAAYDFLLRHRDELLETGGLLESLRRARVRVLLRPSQVYGRALTLARMPRNQRSGLATGLIAETLVAPLLDSAEKPRVWPLLSDEREAFYSGDVPHFTVAGDDVAVVAGDGSHVPLFSLSPLEAVRQRLAALDEADHRRQLSQLDLALAAPVRYGFLERVDASNGLEVGSSADRLADRSRRWALGLADHLLEDEPWCADGEGAQDFSFGRGRLGVALFLLGCARAGESRSTDAARVLLAPLCERPERATELQGLGAFSGLGSVLYALAWAAALEDLALTDSPYLEAVRRALSVADSLLIAGPSAGEHHDILDGTAGLLLGALATADVAGDSTLREAALGIARHAGRRLVGAQRLQGSTGAAWSTPDGGGPLAGMAHGAAGITRALVALAEREGDHRLAVAASAAIAWERSIYDSKQRNWPVRWSTNGTGEARPPVSSMVAWCHGAPGVLLARSMFGEVYRDATWQSEIEAAISTTREAPLPEIDHLCCGLAGRAAALLGAGRRLGRVEAVEAAEELTRQLLDRAEQRRRFRLRGGMLRDRWQSPGFLRGLAGIGWHLLRSAGTPLPDLLALELPSDGGSFDQPRLPRS